MFIKYSNIEYDQEMNIQFSILLLYKCISYVCYSTMLCACNKITKNFINHYYDFAQWITESFCTISPLR